MHENYPQPPWVLTGRFWGALFRTDRPVQLAANLRPLLGRRCAAVALLRYFQGTLIYDELLLGIPVRVGWMPCLWIRDIWVNSDAALYGGLKIWAVPKKLATFTWTAQRVHIADDQGLVATLALSEQPCVLPWVWYPFPILGTVDERRAIAVASARGRLCEGGPSIIDWSERFPFRLVRKPVLTFGSSSFRLRIPGPHS